MDVDVSVDDALSVVVVDGTNSRTIVPIDDRDQPLAVPEGSVTAGDLRRAVGRMRGQGRSAGATAVAEVTVEPRERHRR